MVITFGFNVSGSGEVDDAGLDGLKNACTDFVAGLRADGWRADATLNINKPETVEFIEG